MVSGSMCRIRRNRLRSVVEGREQVSTSAMRHPRLAGKLARKVWGEVCEQMPNTTEKDVVKR